MFKKKDKPKRDHSGKSLSQYGLFDMPDDFDTGVDDMPDDDNDEDLEAELAALAGSGSSPKKPKKPAKRIIPQRELDSMISDTLKGVDDDDDDESVDENDPELLGELNEIAGDSPQAEEDSSVSQDTVVPGPVSSSDTVNVLLERIKNYEICETTAKEAGENMKAKRYNRAIKTLKDLLKQAKTGKPIDLNDDTIPPDIHPPTSNPISPEIPKSLPPSEPVSTPESPKSTPTEEISSTDTPSYDPTVLNTLLERQKQYKIAALKSKQAGDSQKAVLFLKVSKQFDSVISALKSGQPIDLSNMPGPPDEFSSIKEPKPEESEVQQSQPDSEPSSEAAAGGGLITATTVLEALEQRLAVYKEHEGKAKEENNPSKARRYGRIVKQFEQAIKAHNAGKPVAFDELPTPPGYAPIPGLQPAVPEPVETPAPPRIPSRPAPTPSTEDSSKPSASSSGAVGPKHAQAGKQMQILIAKQKQFKLAALEAKNRGEMSQAKEFLRQAKGFDTLIEASMSGLPVDWGSIPITPEAKSQLDNEYHIVMSKEEIVTEDNDLFVRLENQLQKQLKMCLTTRDHNKAIGDVPGTNRFERLALNVTKDLDVVRVSKKTGRVPKFHYETKDFSIVKCFTEIDDNSMEVTVHRGINIKADNPKDIDTYVKMEFPFPQETPFADKTSTIRNTNNPDYGKTFVIPIQRNSRQCQRVFKRHSLKFEVFSKGCSCDTGGCCPCCDSIIGGLCCFGFFRSDVLIGTVNVKLQPLETQCEIHDSFELLEGRKKVGGKLEIQVKLRNPIQTQQVEQIQEKWLLIDQ